MERLCLAFLKVKKFLGSIFSFEQLFYRKNRWVPLTPVRVELFIFPYVNHRTLLFCLFQYICIDAGHVSEKALLQLPCLKRATSSLTQVIGLVPANGCLIL